MKLLAQQNINLKVKVNIWDIIAFLLVIGIITAFAWGSKQMTVHYTPGQEVELSLNPLNLPMYALRSVLRMGAALIFSLIFTFTYATLAAKNKRAEAIMIPVLDVLQSVPILGFLSITVTGFIALFPGRLLGVEAASIFAIFTSQAWNMAFSFYQSLRIVPKELEEASVLFGLSPWQRFWRLEAPFATPNLIWNTMMSVSGGWFFVVASEAITVGKTSVTLPGIGSYVAQAIEQKNLHAIGWALLTMLVVILIYDQILFRPLVAWAEKFKFEMTESQDTPKSWVLLVFKRTALFQIITAFFYKTWSKVIDAFPKFSKPSKSLKPEKAVNNIIRTVIYYLFLFAAILAVLYLIPHFILKGVEHEEIIKVFFLGLLTLLRVIILLLLACIIWVPIGVMIGLHPKWSTKIQPLAQFLAAFPANLLFPIAVFFMVRYRLSPEIWTAPLMILGTQWYILFNVIAGAAAIPTDMREAAESFGLNGWKLWQRLLLPAIFPALLTGIITASGGTWNASIVAEVVSWGSVKLSATGLGSYIARWSEKGDYPHIILGIVVMSIYVVFINRFFWRKLYTICQTKFRLD
ncbi:MAG: ABC transporter permease subunit [Desulfuromonadales bacterium]|nr:ABC transporter permease subunit [Desulfuromonadales bacterium]